MPRGALRVSRHGLPTALLNCACCCMRAPRRRPRHARRPAPATDMPTRGTPPPPLDLHGNRLVNALTGRHVPIRGLNW